MLRSIGNNIAKLAQGQDTLSISVQGVTKDIQLIDETTGDLKSTFEIMQDIYVNGWNKMSNAEKQALGISLAGKNQYEVFTAILSNFGDAQKAVGLATNASGSAMKENERYMQSLQAKLTALKQQFSELVLGQGGLLNFAKTLLTLATNVLKVINAIGGLKTIFVALGAVLVTLNINKFLDVVKLIPTRVGLAVIGVQEFIGSLTALQATLGVVGVALTAFSVITSLVSSAQKKQAQEEARNRQERLETIETLSAETQSLEELRKKLSDESIDREQLSLIIQGSTLSAYDDEISKIEDVNEARERAIELIDEEQKKKAEEVVRTGLQDYGQAKTELEGSGGYKLTMDKDQLLGSLTDVMGQAGLDVGDVQAKLDSGNVIQYKEALEQLIDAIQRTEGASAEYKGILDILGEEYNTVNAKITESEGIIAQYESALSAMGLKVVEVANADGTLTYNIEQMTEADYALLEAQNAGFESTEELGEALDELQEKYELTDEQIEAVANRMIQTGESTEQAYEALYKHKETLEDVVKSYEDAISALDEMDGAFSKLSSAMDEYNSSGEFSMSTLSGLLSMGSEYLALLQFEDGQLSLNQEGMLALANARIDEAEAMAYNQAVAELDALAHDQLADSVGQSGSASYQASSDIQSTIPALDQCIAKCNQASNAWNSLWASMSRFSFSGKDISGAQNNIIGGLKNTITALEGARSSLGKYTSSLAGGGGGGRSGGGGGGGGGATKAVDEHTEALKEQKKALEELIKQYETVIKYIKSKVSEKIDELEELRDTAIDAVKEQIRVLEEQEKAELDLLETQKKALEEKADKEDEYWEKKIQAFKEQNEAIEEQIELERLQEQLAKAKNQKVMVFKDGRFQWATDQNAVDKAQKELTEYQRKQEYEKQLKELENFRDKAKENYKQQIKDLDDKIKETESRYEQQITDLESFIEEIKLDYNEQIKYYKEWEKKFEKQVNAYENEQNRLLALQLTGIDFENKNWTTRLNNLDSFVANYKKKQEELAKITAQINASASSATSGGGGGGGGGYGGYGGGLPSAESGDYIVYQVLGKYKSAQEASKNRSRLGGDGITTLNGNYVVYKKIKTGLSSSQASAEANRLSQAVHGRIQYVATNRYASGASSIKDDEFAIVGDNPNKEIVLGAKLNNGVGMKLSKGSGVINAESTKTLAGLFNTLGKTRSMMPSSNYQLRDTMGNNVTQTFKFDNLVLPNVNNAETFVKALSDKFQNYSIQYCNKH